MKKLKIVGKRYGKLKVLKEIQGNAKHRSVLCLCDCGSQKPIMVERLTAKRVISCGCVFEERLKHRNIKYQGESNKRSKEYNAWKRLRLSCNCKTNKDYHNYGGRGIKVCKRWDNFMNFYLDMGPAPSKKHSLDRIDVNGNYEPNNCRWVTISTQANNRRATIFVNYKNELIPRSVFCRQFRLSNNVVLTRLRRGMTGEQILIELLGGNFEKYNVSMAD